MFLFWICSCVCAFSHISPAPLFTLTPDCPELHLMVDVETVLSIGWYWSKIIFTIASISLNTTHEILWASQVNNLLHCSSLLFFF